MNKLLNNYYESFKPEIEPYVDYAESIDEIYSIIYNKFNIKLTDFNFNIVTRTTEKGFKLNFHRDNYLIRKFKDGYKWIPYDKEEKPLYSLIHYLNDDFSGGELIIYPNIIIKPKKNMFVFIDSNTIHKVNYQKSGLRKINLFKFY